MKIRTLLEEIFQNESNLFIRDEESFTVDDLVGNITAVMSKNYLVEAEWDVADSIPDAGDFDIDVNGYLLFYFICHDHYFYIEKLESKNEFEIFMNDVYDNYFFTDIVLLKDGKVVFDELIKKSQIYRHNLLIKGW